MQINVDIAPIRNFIKATLVEKNRCRYNAAAVMKSNPFCKFLFVLCLLTFPLSIYYLYYYVIDIVNDLKIINGETDDDDYTQFTSYEMFGILILLMYVLLVEIFFIYVLYVLMKECNCAQVSLFFWKSPFWKYLGMQVISWIIFVVLLFILFFRYSSSIVKVMLLELNSHFGFLSHLFSYTSFSPNENRELYMREVHNVKRDRNVIEDDDEPDDLNPLYD